MVQACRQVFELQRAQAIQNLDYSKIGKAYRMKDWLDDLVDWQGTQDQLAQALQQIVFVILTETGRDAMSEIGKPASTYDPFTPALEEYFQTKSLLAAESINEETAKQLRASLSEGVKAGESSYELRARVENIMGTASTMRADRIARTEVARAQGFADIQAWAQSGVVVAKEWFTARDERVCPFCGSLDGKVFGLDENIFDKGDSLTIDGQTQHFNYDDVPSAPLHVNCRCTLLPVKG